MTAQAKNEDVDNELTQFMLHHCYTCPDANECDTEARCRACMEEKREKREEEEGRQLTRNQLKEYAL
ncbi:hypothetical protein B1748_04175 [Paenibacillus sp. MY03]|jgi:hypothetical protein|nr:MULTISPECIES: hypothetical protein [Paenibacillus]OUS77975.1 hypothetical protein B1748_04175 [Paenibacillus sp. MY03]